MQKRFEKYIQENHLFETPHKILLTISGGIDSIVMFDLFLKSQKYNFAIAHCNFGLRSKESDQDEIFVRSLGKKHDIPVYTQRFDTQTYARQHKISIQMAARDLRYTWFAELLRTERYDLVATAHHKNDVIETVLLNITHGTGIAGLHGILPKNKDIIRPLLFARKEEIEKYAQENHLTWREDASNADDKYERNLLRLKVIPLLQKLNPNLENTLEQTVDKLRQTEAVFLRQVAFISEKVCKKVGANYFVDLKVLEIETDNVIVLFHILQEFGFSYLQTKEIWKKRTEHSGKLFESASHSLVKDRNQLVITDKSSIKNTTDIICKNQKVLHNSLLKLNFEEIERDENFKIDPNPNIAFLDLDKLIFPLELRIWQQGEKFFPLGMKNQRKISDFLIDVKVPLNLKDKVFVLLSHNQIIWLVGHRIDERFKIMPDTQKILKITLETQ